ncbi:MAG TPA: MerR family transcriptional regulator [Solirubrobacterales bacterium]|nr:MerR family transcriptional regulator [Solirubrobacterales bacterium]
MSATEQTPAETNGGRSLTIDELARETGMTARNIRAHQSRGLLPPPEVRARTGYYAEDHVARIKLIQDMQSQGFNLKAIERLLELGAHDGSENTLAFERAILTPFGTEQPEVINTAELIDALGGDVDAKTLARAGKLGVARSLGNETWEIPSPTLLRAAAALVELGVPLSHALAVGSAIRKHTRSIAKEFVRLYVQDVLDPVREGGSVDEAGLDAAREAVERLRPLASEAVLASFGQVMTEAVEQQLQRELKQR